MKEGAKESFAEKHGCPLDRVTVKERPDISPASRYPFNSKPSAEIASDPDRLANADQEEKKKRWEKGREVFEVSGCGKTEILKCAHPSSNNRDGQRPNQVICQ